MRKYSPYGKKIVRVELTLQQNAKKRGYAVLSRGWPDFLLHRADEVRFIEVKREGEELSKYQTDLFTLMKKVGITVWISVDGQLDNLLEFSTYCKRLREPPRRIIPVAPAKLSDTPIERRVRERLDALHKERIARRLELYSRKARRH